MEMSANSRDAATEASEKDVWHTPNWRLLSRLIPQSERVEWVYLGLSGLTDADGALGAVIRRSTTPTSLLAIARGAI